MSLRDLMLADLESAVGHVRDGHEVVPSWRILAPEGDFIIHTRFADKPEQRSGRRFGMKRSPRRSGAAAGVGGAWPIL